MKEELKTSLQPVVSNTRTTHVGVHVLLMTIDKFDLNPILIDINKLKPYRFVKEHTLQLVLVKPNDLLPI
jgi:hypothetical protein